MARTLTGTVSSDKRDKTITVNATSRETHPIYRKQFTVTRKYSAHDEKNTAHIGDKVIIVEHRPFSKTKTWNLVKIIEKSKGKIELKEDIVTQVVSPQTAKEKSGDEEPAKTTPSRTVRSHDEDLATKPVTTGLRSVSEKESSSKAATKKETKK